MADLQTNLSPVSGGGLNIWSFGKCKFRCLLNHWTFIFRPNYLLLITTRTYLVHWSRHIVTDGTFSITKAANPTNNICGTRVNEATLRQVRGAKMAKLLCWKCQTLTSKALLFVVGKALGLSQVATTKRSWTFVGEDAGTSLVVVHERLAIEVVLGDCDALRAELFTAFQVNIWERMVELLQNWGFWICWIVWEFFDE